MDSTGLSSAAAALWAPSSATTCLLSSTAIPLVFTSCAAVSSSPSPASPSLSSQRRPILLTFLLMVQLTVRSSIIRSPAPSRTRHSEPGPRKLSRFVSSWPAYSSSLFSPSFHTEHDEPTCSRRLGTAFVPANSPRPFDRCVTPVANSHVD